MGKRYEVGIAHFPSVIKGTTLVNILKRYFSDRPEAVRRRIAEESEAFDRTMPFPPMPGSLEFLRMLKERGVRTALVTSSDNEKVERAFRLMGIQDLFDTAVTASMIQKGKPDPSCYLLAAGKLGAAPAECVVFEDSFAGIQAGKAAGMRVVALASTNPAEQLADKADRVVANLQEITWEEYLRL